MTAATVALPAANGEGELFARTWLVDEPHALVQIVHGMSEHSGRYEEFACYLNSLQYSVVALDLPGHGQSTQGHLGSFAATPGGFDYALEDIHHLFELAASQADAMLYDNSPFRHCGLDPQSQTSGYQIADQARNDVSPSFANPLPYILFGHSMGSILAGLYADRCASQPGQLAALVMSGTPLIPAAGAVRLLASAIAATRGQLARSPLLERLTGSLAGVPLDEAVRKRAWLTRDTEKIREFSLDPLCGFDYSAGGYAALFSGVQQLYARSWGAHLPADLPVLIMAGADDSSGGRGAGPTRLASHLERTDHTRVTLKLFEGARHELLNETNRAEVYAYLTEWLSCSSS